MFKFLNKKTLQEKQEIKEAKLLEKKVQIINRFKEGVEKETSKETCIELLGQLQRKYLSYGIISDLDYDRNNEVDKVLDIFEEVYPVARERALSLGAELDIKKYPLSLEDYALRMG